jgi:divalent metal cation (Fe/Co/Zn/Cd) transporter
VALLAIAGGQIYPFMDPVGGCLVSLLIIRVGFQSGRAACQEIVDRGLEPEVLDLVKEGAQRGLVQGLKESLNTDRQGIILGSIKGTKSGAYYIVDVEIEGPGNMTLDSFERLKGGVVESVKEDVKGVKIVRVFAKTRKAQTNGIH